MIPSRFTGSVFVLRPWRPSDRPALIRHADNRAIWRNLRDHFPHPYTDADADAFLAFAAADPPPEGMFAIEVDGEAVGTIALERGADVERLSMEIGYWLAESYWGRGIVSEAVGILTEAALAEPDVVRVFAPVFGWNGGSMRVLEKNGFAREAVLRRAGFKDGVVMDRVVYARSRDSAHPYVPARSDGEPPPRAPGGGSPSDDEGLDQLAAKQ